MDYVEQVTRLVDALAFSLSTLPDSVNHNEVIQKVLSIIIKTCESSNFEKKEIITITKNPDSTLEEDINSEVETSHPDNLLELNLGAFESKAKRNSSEDNDEDTDNEDEIKNDDETENDYETKNDDESKNDDEKKPKKRVYKYPYKYNYSKLTYKYHCIFCEKHFHTPEEQLKHDENLHKNSSGYLCKDCKYTNESKIEVMNHYGDSHKTPSNIKYCFECKQAFYQVTQLRQHFKILHDIDIPMETCLMCHETFPSYKKAAYHMDTVHRNFKVRCSKYLCHKLFDTILELNNHSMTHVIPDILKCDQCDKEFSQNTVFQRHIKSHTMEKSFTCPHCAKQFYFEVEMRYHVNNFHNHKYICDQCDYKTYSGYRLNIHNIMKHTDKEEHICNDCGKSFKLIKYLERHKETHSEERKYKCDICGKGFKHQKHVIVHRRIHLKDYKAQCAVCGRNFVQKSNLKLHMKKHHPDVDINIERS